MWQPCPSQADSPSLPGSLASGLVCRGTGDVPRRGPWKLAPQVTAPPALSCLGHWLGPGSWHPGRSLALWAACLACPVCLSSE